MPRWCWLLVVAMFCSATYAQTPNKSGDTSWKPVFRWERGAVGCDLRYVQGTAIREFNTDHYWIAAGMTEEFGKSVGVVAVWIYKTGHRIELGPENIQLFAEKNGTDVEIKREDPKKMASSIERRARIASGLSTFGAGMRTDTTTATTSSGDTVRLSTPDYSARQQASDDATSSIANAETLGGMIKDGALKENTLDPDQSVHGRVYFKRQKRGRLLLRVQIGDEFVEFPFSAPDDTKP